MRWLLLAVGLLLSATGIAQTKVYVTGASHHGTLIEDGVMWESVVVGHANYRPYPLGAQIPLAVPLPPEVEVRGDDISAVRDASGAVVALAIDGVPGRHTVQTWQPVLGNALRPPLPAASVVQRITLDHATFEADPALGLEHRIRYTRHPAVSRRDRRKTDKAASSRRARAHEQPIYLLADARLVEAGGLTGTVSPAGAPSARVTAFVMGLFALVLVVLVLVYRMLGRQVRWERADAYIRTEFMDDEVDAEEVPRG